MIFLFACAPSGMTLNHSTTQVELRAPNFKLVAKDITGTAEASYLVGLSYSYGMVTNSLALYRLEGSGLIYKEAMENLWKRFEEKYGAVEGRKLGLINVRYDADIINLLLYTKVTIYITADVVEFQ
jgi:hypothetical protein